MRISRIFRKYSRVLLLVFMSLLLVVFLLGDVISRAARSQSMREIEIGIAFGEPVYLKSTHAADSDFELAARLGLGTVPILTDDERERNLAGFLLLEEAHRAGISVGRDQIRARLQNTAGAPEVLEIIRARTGRSLNSIYDALARVRATMLLAEYQAGAAVRASVPELERAYRDQNQEARVRISVIDTAAFLSQVEVPTEEELQAHFEEAKDRSNAHTPEALSFGYRVADCVQVEYLTVDPTKIKSEVRVSRRERQRYYDENKHKYMKTVEESSSFTLQDEQPQKVPMTYEEAEKQVREDCRAAKAITEAQRLVNDIHHAARRAWDAAPPGENDVRQASADDPLVSFEELRDEFSSEYPVIYKKTGLVTVAELGREPGFGRATRTIERQRVPVASLAFRVEGLAAAEAEEDTPILRINEPGPLVMETRAAGSETERVPYQAYVFRVIRVRPTGPPASLDDVREEAVENLEQLKAFDLGGEQAKALAERARQVGLEQAVAEAEQLRTMLAEDEPEQPPTTEPAEVSPTANRYLSQLEPFEPEQFLRQPRNVLKNVGYAPHLHEQVFALADEKGAEEHQVLVVPLAQSRKWAVVEFLALKPIYRGEFEMKREELQRQSAWFQVRAFYAEWFNPENIFDRTGYVPATPIEPQEARRP